MRKSILEKSSQQWHMQVQPPLHFLLFSAINTTTKWKLHHLKQIHGLLTTCALSNHPSLLTKLLFRCTCLPSFPCLYASYLFDQIPQPNISAYNNLFRGFSTSSTPENVVLYYVKMRRAGVFPNKHTFPLLLKAKTQDPFQLFAQIVKFGFGSDQFVQNSLVSVFASSSCIDSARQAFGENLHKDMVGYTALIDGYVRNGRAVEALELFLEMRVLGVKVDEVLVVSALCAVGILRCVWFGRWIHGFYVESGKVFRDVYVDSALVDMYSKCGCCVDAVKVFKEMPYRNLVSWSALIAGYVQCNRFNDALLAFQEMLVAKVEPNEATITSVLTACARLGALHQGRWLHKHTINSQKLCMNSKLGTALIDMYSKCGCIQEAMLVFERMIDKDVYPWTAMINGLAMHGDAARSLSLFSQMLSFGIRPNEVTFIGVLSACSHGGFVDEGRRLFSRMESVYGIKPNVDHYGCIIDLFGRAGMLREALKLIEDMPMEPTPNVWGALFGACKIHKAYELGELIGKHLIEIQPHHSGRYALLANLYSTCENWKGAARVRKIMKGIRVEKTPGCSWIELYGSLLEFIAFDKTHDQSEIVHMIVDSLSVQLDFSGPGFDIDLLMLDKT